MQPGKGYSITYSAPSLGATPPDRAARAVRLRHGLGSGFRLGSTMEFSGYDETLNERRLAALERGAAEYLRRPSVPRCVRSGTAGGRCASMTCR
jgi:D-amino-acid dehydrogenase